MWRDLREHGFEGQHRGAGPPHEAADLMLLPASDIGVAITFSTFEPIILLRAKRTLLHAESECNAAATGAPVRLSPHYHAYNQSLTRLTRPPSLAAIGHQVQSSFHQKRNQLPSNPNVLLTKHLEQIPPSPEAITRTNLWHLRVFRGIIVEGCFHYRNMRLRVLR